MRSRRTKKSVPPGDSRPNASAIFSNTVINKKYKYWCFAGSFHLNRNQKRNWKKDSVRKEDGVLSRKAWDENEIQNNTYTRPITAGVRRASRFCRTKIAPEWKRK